jgi:GTP-binding protein HflX
LSADLLFATLDPTLRAVDLPKGMRIILSDTVGFISDLPTMLVAAFRATLEEVIEADLILHVRDVAHAESAAQSEDVASVLRQLGIDPADTDRLIEVWNKIDLLDPDRLLQVANIAHRSDPDRRPFLVSALSGEGIETLSLAIEAKLARHWVTLELAVDPADGAGVSWLHRHTDVIAKSISDDGRLAMTVRVEKGREQNVRQKFQAFVASAPRKIAAS